MTKFILLNWCSFLGLIFKNSLVLLHEFSLFTTWTAQKHIGVLSHLCPKNFSTAPPKTCCANLQNYSARLTPLSNIRLVGLIIPNCGHFISLDRMNSVFRTLNTKKNFFSFLAAGFCPKNLAFARKIMVWGALPAP